MRERGNIKHAKAESGKRAKNIELHILTRFIEDLRKQPPGTERELEAVIRVIQAAEDGQLNEPQVFLKLEELSSSAKWIPELLRMVHELRQPSVQKNPCGDEDSRSTCLLALAKAADLGSCARTRGDTLYSYWRTGELPPRLDSELFGASQEERCEADNVIRKAMERLESNPANIKEFLALMCSYGPRLAFGAVEQIPADSRFFFARLTELFQGDPGLLDQFAKFLPLGQGMPFFGHAEPLDLTPESILQGIGPCNGARVS